MAYCAALAERTRDRASLDWAMTDFDSVCVCIVLFDKTQYASHLDQDAWKSTLAKMVYAEAEAGYYLGRVDKRLTAIAEQRAVTG